MLNSAKSDIAAMTLYQSVVEGLGFHVTMSIPFKMPLRKNLSGKKVIKLQVLQRRTRLHFDRVVKTLLIFAHTNTLNITLSKPLNSITREQKLSSKNYVQRPTPPMQPSNFETPGGLAATLQALANASCQH